MYQEAQRSQPSSSVNPRELRECDRVDVEADITFFSEDNFYQGFSENISEGGLFVVTYLPRKCGDVITVRFTLPGIEHTLEARAEVRWVRAGIADRHLPPGLGVRFLDLSQADRAIVERFVRKREPLFFDE